MFLPYSFLAIGIVHCVGDEPDVGSASSAQDAATGDGSTGDASSGSDANSSTDGATIDAGVDAGFVDDCLTHNDCPKNVQGSSLQLWLRGGIGETCVGNRLTLWTDSSGDGNNATPTTNGEGDAAVPPQCDVAKIGSNPVVTFTAPAENDAGKFTEYVDETLDVNLTAVENSDYTIIVVHERSVDVPMALMATEELVLGRSWSPMPRERN